MGLSKPPPSPWVFSKLSRNFAVYPPGCQVYFALDDLWIKVSNEPNNDSKSCLLQCILVLEI